MERQTQEQRQRQVQEQEQGRERTVEEIRQAFREKAVKRGRLVETFTNADVPEREGPQLWLTVDRFEDGIPLRDRFTGETQPVPVLRVKESDKVIVLENERFEVCVAATGGDFSLLSGRRVRIWREPLISPFGRPITGKWKRMIAFEREPGDDSDDGAQPGTSADSVEEIPF